MCVPLEYRRTNSPHPTCLHASPRQLIPSIYHSITEELRSRCYTRVMLCHFISILPGSGVEVFVERVSGRIPLRSLTTLNISIKSPQAIRRFNENKPKPASLIICLLLDLQSCVVSRCIFSKQSLSFWNETTKPERSTPNEAQQKPHTEKRNSSHFDTTVLTSV